MADVWTHQPQLYTLMMNFRSPLLLRHLNARGAARYITPLKINILNPKSWRFGSDDFPFQFRVICRFQPFIFQGVTYSPLENAPGIWRLYQFPGFIFPTSKPWGLKEKLQKFRIKALGLEIFILVQVFRYSSWGLNHPSQKLFSSNWIISPNFRVENKKYLKPPPSFFCSSVFFHQKTAWYFIYFFLQLLPFPKKSLLSYLSANWIRGFQPWSYLRKRNMASNTSHRKHSSPTLHRST